MVIIVGEKESLLPVKVNSAGLGRITPNSLPRTSLRYQYCRKLALFFTSQEFWRDYHEQFNLARLKAGNIDKSHSNRGIALKALTIRYVGFI